MEALQLLVNLITWAGNVAYNIGVFLLGYGAYKYLTAPRKK